MPNGAGNFDVVTITQDISYPSLSHTNADRMVFVNTSTNTLNGYDDDWVFSGSTAPSPNGTTYAWYDTTNNVVKYTNDSGATWTTGLSLPICIGNYVKDTGFTSIDTVFNGLGYIGSHVFFLPGYSVLTPNGRNKNGVLNNRKYTFTKVTTYTRNLTDRNVPLLVRYNGTVAFSTGVSFDPIKNKSITADGYCVVGTATLASGVISDFNPKLVYSSVDYQDFIDKTEENYRPKNVFVKLSGSDENNGLTSATAMKTIEAAYKKFSKYKYIIINIAEAGEYQLGDGLNFGEEFMMNGHSTIFNATVSGVKLTGNIYWLSGNVEMMNLTCDCYCSFRCNQIVFNDCTFNGEFHNKSPFVLSNCTFNNFLYVTSCSGEFRDCIFNDDTDRSKINVAESNIKFSNVTINTTVSSSTNPFIKGYSSLITFTNTPVFSGTYKEFVWSNACIVTLANQTIYDSVVSNTAFGINSFNGGTIKCSHDVSIGARPMITISSSDNLNSYTEPGVFVCRSGATNNPVAADGILTIQRGVTNQTEQTLHCLENSNIEFYKRKYNKNSNTWTNWYRFTGTAV